MSERKDGELYKKISLRGKDFEIRYGYYEDYEKESEFNDPIPIYPDFEKDPIYTDDGYPFVTQMQSACKYGDSSFSDGFCVDCSYFMHGDDLVGICECPEKKLQ